MSLSTSARSPRGDQYSFSNPTTAQRYLSLIENRPNPAAIKAAIAAGASCSRLDSKRSSPFIAAILRKDETVALEMLRQEPNCAKIDYVPMVTTRRKNPSTSPLCLASNHRLQKLFSALCAAGCEVNTPLLFGESLLGKHLTAFEYDWAIDLIKAGAHVDIMTLASQDSGTLFDLLLDRKLHVLIEAVVSRSLPLPHLNRTKLEYILNHSTASPEVKCALIRPLLARYSIESIVNKFFMLTFYRGETQLAARLLEEGLCQINEKCFEGHQVHPLLVATLQPSPLLFNSFLAMTSDVATVRFGLELAPITTPLRIAISERNLARVKELHASGARLTECYRSGMTPLRVAVAAKAQDIVDYLLSHTDHSQEPATTSTPLRPISFSLPCYKERIHPTLLPSSPPSSRYSFASTPLEELPLEMEPLEGQSVEWQLFEEQLHLEEQLLAEQLPPEELLAEEEVDEDEVEENPIGEPEIGETLTRLRPSETEDEASKRATDQTAAASYTVYVPSLALKPLTFKPLAVHLYYDAGLAAIEKELSREKHAFGCYPFAPIDWSDGLPFTEELVEALQRMNDLQIAQGYDSSRTQQPSALRDAIYALSYHTIGSEKTTEPDARDHAVKLAVSLLRGQSPLTLIQLLSPEEICHLFRHGLLTAIAMPFFDEEGRTSAREITLLAWLTFFEQKEVERRAIHLLPL